MDEDLRNKAALIKEINELTNRVEKRLEKLYKIRPLSVENLSKGEDIKNDLRNLRRIDFIKDKAVIEQANYWVKRLNDNGIFLRTPLE